MRKVNYYITFKSADGLSVVQDMGTERPAPEIRRVCSYPVIMWDESHHVEQVPSTTARRYTFCDILFRTIDSVMLEYREGR